MALAEGLAGIVARLGNAQLCECLILAFYAARLAQSMGCTGPPCMHTTSCPLTCCACCAPAAAEERLKAAVELKDRISDAVAGSDQSVWAQFVQPCCALLRSVPPVLVDNTQHKLRNTCLDILGRVPQAETVKQLVPEVFEVCHSVLNNDNQDNAVAALKVMFDSVKAYRSALETQAQQLLETALQVCVCVCVRARVCVWHRPLVLALVHWSIVYGK